MFDEFAISSRGGYYHVANWLEPKQWLLAEEGNAVSGTLVRMGVALGTTRTTQKVFESFAGENKDNLFTKTTVPVRLAQYEGEALVSRSQAKRILARVDQFREVVLDFTDVKETGPSFADEIFRVFAIAHREVRLLPVNAKGDVRKMINRAQKQMLAQDLRRK